MVDFVFSSQKQYWSSVKNLHKHLGNNTTQGIQARKSFKALTGNRKYNESNFQKRNEKGKTYSIKEVRSDFSTARKRAEENLRKDWKQAKKEGKTSISFKKFKEINQEPDYDAIQESYNSPT